jgi:hypothetical protein
MALERLPVLAAWHLGFDAAGKLKGAITYCNAKKLKRLRVRFDVEEQPPGFFPVHGGVVYVEESADVDVESPSRDMAAIDQGGGRFRWHEGGLDPNVPCIMMALILPEGYTVRKPSPAPISAKDFKGRLAPIGNQQLILRAMPTQNGTWRRPRAILHLKSYGLTNNPPTRQFPHRGR